MHATLEPCNRVPRAIHKSRAGERQHAVCMPANPSKSYCPTALATSTGTDVKGCRPTAVVASAMMPPDSQPNLVIPALVTNVWLATCQPRAATPARQGQLVPWLLCSMQQKGMRSATRDCAYTRTQHVVLSLGAPLTLPATSSGV